MTNGATIRFDTTILHSYFNYFESDMKVLEEYENRGFEVPKTGVFKVKCRLIEEKIGNGLLTLWIVKILEVEAETTGNEKTQDSIN